MVSKGVPIACEMIMAKEYVAFDPKMTGGYPAARDLYYECGTCGELVPSLPADNAFCSCRNIIVDVEAGRISIKRHSDVRLVRQRSEA